MRCVRSLVLIALAVFLSSTGSKTRQTNFIFTNVLAQIGLGYMVVFLLAGRSPRVQLATAPGDPGGLLAAVRRVSPSLAGVRPQGAGHPRRAWRPLPGFFAHWDMNTNPAAAFDRWFLNLFPRPANDPFRFNEGGYATLNFIPSIATMIFGLLAGELVRSERPAVAKLRTLVMAGALCLVAGTVLDVTVCPVVKRIWTPSWAIYSTGWASGNWRSSTGWPTWRATAAGRSRWSWSASTRSPCT